MGDLIADEELYLTPKGLADRIAKKKAHEAEAVEALYVELISQFLQNPWENNLGEEALEAINSRLGRVKATPIELENAFRLIIANTNKFSEIVKVIPGQKFPNSYLSSLISNIENAVSYAPDELRETIADQYFLIFKAMMFNPAGKKLKDIIDFDNRIKIIKNKRMQWITSKRLDNKATKEELEELNLHTQRLNGGVANAGRQLSTKPKSRDREG